MAEPTLVVRRSTRSRKVVSYVDTEDIKPSIKRTASTAFADDDEHAAITANVPRIISEDNTTKFEHTVKDEVEYGDTLATIPPYEVEHEFTKNQVKATKPRKSTKKSKALSDEEEFETVQPKRKAAKKKKKKDEPHVLVLTPDMVRPPGERKLPMIYPVVKKARDPNVNVLAEMVASFHERVRRARARVKPLELGEEETRLKAYVHMPDDHYYEALRKANTERMFLLERTITVEEDCHTGHTDCPIFDILMSGSKGNVYMVSITHQPTCSCADHMFRKRTCKHILYVLHKVLKVPEHLQQQDAFLTSELREMAANAPTILSGGDNTETNNGRRKPIEDDCAICCMELHEHEDIVWCKAACGNNIHKQCFDQWALSRPHKVTCPFCRSQWQRDSQTVKLTDITMPTQVNNNGYFNVADQLGY